MVEDRIPRGFKDQFPSRRRRPSFSSALLDAISRSTDPNASGKSVDMRRKSRVSILAPATQHFHLEDQFLCESPRFNTSSWLYCSSEGEMSNSRRPLRRAQDDFGLKQEPPLPPPSKKKQMKVKPVSPGSKLATFINSLFTPRKSQEKAKLPPKSFSHSASMSSRSAATAFSKRVSDYKRYDSSCGASLHTKRQPFSVNNSPSAVKTQSHKSVTFCSRNVVLDENYNRSENAHIQRDKQNGKHCFHHGQVLYEAEEEEEVASDSSSDLFELDNLNFMDMDLPVFGTTHWETSK